MYTYKYKMFTTLTVKAVTVNCILYQCLIKRRSLMKFSSLTLTVLKLYYFLD